MSAQCGNWQQRCREMKILELRHIETCFDGSFIKEALLSGEITRAFIMHLGEGADLQYFENFPRHLFIIDIPDCLYIKGIEGNRTIRITLKNDTGLAQIGRASCRERV